MSMRTYEELRRDLLRKHPELEMIDAERTASQRDAMAICTKLKQLRVKATLSQRQVAERLGIDQSTVSRIENGKENLSLEELFLYARACGSDALVSFFSDDDVTDAEESYKSIVNDIVFSLFHRKKEYTNFIERKDDQFDSIIDNSMNMICLAIKNISQVIVFYKSMQIREEDRSKKNED